MKEKRDFKRRSSRGPPQSTEEKVGRFVMRNSENGFFTRITTISRKFEISESDTWDVVGELLSNGRFESAHDEFTGEMKLCLMDQTYKIMEQERKRKRARNGSKKKKQKSTGNAGDDENMPAQCHPVTKPDAKRKEK